MDRYVSSRLLSNGQSWGPLTPAQLRPVHAVYSEVLRIIMGKQGVEEADRLLDECLYSPHTRYLTVELHLRKKRLIFVDRVLLFGSQLLKAALQMEAMSDHSWAGLIRADFMWLVGRHRSLKALPPPFAEGVAVWGSYILFNLRGGSLLSCLSLIPFKTALPI